MTSDFFSHDEIKIITESFLESSYTFSSIIDLTRDFTLSFHHDKSIVKEWREGLPFDELMEVSEKVVHPMFYQSFKDTFSKANLEHAFEENEQIRMEVLFLRHINQNYSWQTLRMTPIKSLPNRMLFMYTGISTDSAIRERETKRIENFNNAVLRQLIYDHILVYIVDLDSKMSRLVLSREGDAYDEYARTFKEHIDMMKHLRDNYVHEDFVKDFSKYIDYDYILKQLESGRDHIIFVFRDKRARTFELSIMKYAGFSEDNKMIIYSIKQLS